MPIRVFLKNSLIILGAFILLSLSTLAQAFVVKKIQFQGLVRVSKNMLGDLPIKAGESLTPQRSNALIKYLYDVNMPYSLFKQVTLLNDHGTLIIRLIESPTIADVSFSGNVNIKKAQIKDVLKKAEIEKGKVYSPFMLDQIKKSFLQAYYSKGKYAAKINTIVTTVKHNQVKIDIKISEGIAAKITSINFVGNHVFSDRTLTSQLTVTTPRLWSFFTDSDKYSSDKMQKSVDALRSYYMDHGYLHFNVSSYQVALSPYRRKTFLTFNVTEGGKYTFKGYKLIGNFVLPKATLSQKVKITKGDVFSRKKILDGIKGITDLLANDGYAYANVTPNLKVDEKTKQVSITLYINPGNRVYVRYIHFLGNSVTNDKVFRQYLQLMESSLYSKHKVALSKMFIQRLPYVKSVNDSMAPVPNNPDAVDLNYNVKEQSANRIMANVGYDTLLKWFVGGGVTFGNVLGTGNTLSLNGRVGKYQKQLSTSFTQPYFTDSGISQTVSAYWSTTNTENVNFVSYMMDSYGASLSYGIPLSLFNYFHVGGSYDHRSIKLPASNVSQVVKDFTDANGKNFNNFTLSLGWSRNSTNLLYFPTQGVRANVSATATVPFSSLNYYTLSSSATWYQLIWPKVVLTFSGNASYGKGYGKTKNYPFYLNQYAGGWGTVRGYDNASLGPVSSVTCDSKTDGECGKDGDNKNTKPYQPVGGNLLVNASVGLVFPVPFFDTDKARLTVFTDTGYVYNTQTLPGVYNGTDPKTGIEYKNPRLPNFKNLRWGVGGGVMFIIPQLGPIGLSLSKAIGYQRQDHRTVFNFSMGRPF